MLPWQSSTGRAPDPDSKKGAGSNSARGNFFNTCIFTLSKVYFSNH